MKEYQKARSQIWYFNICSTNIFHQLEQTTEVLVPYCAHNIYEKVELNFSNNLSPIEAIFLQEN